MLLVLKKKSCEYLINWDSFSVFSNVINQNNFSLIGWLCGVLLAHIECTAGDSPSDAFSHGEKIRGVAPV